MQPHISIKAEALYDVFGFTITNSFVLSLVVILFFIGLGLSYRSELQKTEKSMLFYPFHMLVNGIYDLFKTVLKEKTDKFFPLLAALFFFILLNNWFGLLPGVGSLVLDHEFVAANTAEAHAQEYADESKEETIAAGTEKAADEAKEKKKPHDVPIFRAGTADLNTTFALAILAFLVIQYYSFVYLGAAGFVQRFFASLNPLNIIVGVLEVISELSKIVSLSFRLFGNILAGEILLVVIAFLIPVLASFPFFLFEIFVGIMQALVFAILTAVFLATSTEKAHH